MGEMAVTVWTTASRDSRHFHEHVYEYSLLYSYVLLQWWSKAIKVFSVFCFVIRQEKLYNIPKYWNKNCLGQLQSSIIYVLIATRIENESDKVLDF